LDEVEETGPASEGRKRKRNDEPCTPSRKSRKLVDQMAQTTPSLNRIRTMDILRCERFTNGKASEGDIDGNNKSVGNASGGKALIKRLIT
jgi:hypothetical protein